MPPPFWGEGMPPPWGWRWVLRLRHFSLAPTKIFNINHFHYDALQDPSYRYTPRPLSFIVPRGIQWLIYSQGEWTRAISGVATPLPTISAWLGTRIPSQRCPIQFVRPSSKLYEKRTPSQYEITNTESKREWMDTIFEEISKKGLQVDRELSISR